MFSFLIVALFAVLSLSVSACPVRSNTDQLPTYTITPIPSTYLAPTPSPSTPTPSVPVSPPTLAAVSLENTGGVATYFYQNGVAGACGVVHSDSDYICAMDEALYGDPNSVSPLCGDQVQITNLNNGQTVTVTVADDCPTCQNANSIDLSVAAFEAIADLYEGVVSISWDYV